MGRYAESVLTGPVIDEATSYFEDKIKRTFNLYEIDDDEEEYSVRIRGAPELPEIGLESGFLELRKSSPPAHFPLIHREECKQIFEPVFLEIRRLIEAQTANVIINTRSSPKVNLWQCEAD